MIKVVHIQFSTESGGRAALRLQRALLKKNIDSNIVSLLRGSPGISRITYLGMKSKFLSRIDNKLQSFLTRKILPKMGSFSYPVLGTDISSIEVIKNADIIYIHWALNGMLNIKSIKRLAQLNKPVIFFLHDMWTVTGGCHHSFDCTKYKTTGCQACPMFGHTVKDDLAAREFRKKKRLYSKYNNLYFVSPSNWLYDCAKASLLTKDKPVFYIPNILDDNIFKENNATIAKQLLNTNTDEKVIAFGAIDVNSPYKGWAYLQRALEIFHATAKDSNISVLIFGSGYNKQMDDAIPFKVKFMGYIKDEYAASLVFNAADVFIAPSLAEAFGYVVMESLSCGTPVVGFNVGGIPDMIKHKENGYLAKYKDAEDLAEGISYCLANNIKGSLPPGLKPELTIQKHLDLFDHILSLKHK